MFFSKRKRIIKKSMMNALKSVVEKTPKIYQHFFYGAFDTAPENLAIWYLFETDAELKLAQTNGMCDELAEATYDNLKLLGYPDKALCNPIKYSLNEKTKLQGSDEEMKNKIVGMLENRKVTVSFTTKEDIDRIADGDYHLYFQ